MNKRLLLLFTLIAFSVSGQETKRIKKDHGNFSDLEIFNVLKSDKSIKHGPYEKFFKYSNPMTKGKLLTERGQYDNNVKTGTWTYYWGENNMISKGSYDNDLRSGNWEYYKNGIVTEKGGYANDEREGLWTYFEKEKGILEKGYYQNGNKVGKWTYYYYNIPVQTYDHSLDTLLQFYDDKSESEAIVDSSNEIVKIVLSQTPQYVGHKRQMQRDMANLTKYPIEARRMGIEGQVVVSVMVNEDGTTSDLTVLKDIGGNCGKAVIDAYQASTSKWIPGIYNGKKVKVKYYQTVSFKLKIDPISGLGQSEIVYE